MSGEYSQSDQVRGGVANTPDSGACFRKAGRMGQFWGWSIGWGDTSDMPVTLLHVTMHRAYAQKGQNYSSLINIQWQYLTKWPSKAHCHPIQWGLFKFPPKPPGAKDLFGWKGGPKEATQIANPPEVQYFILEVLVTSECYFYNQN